MPVTIRYSEAFIRKAIWHFWLRKIGWFDALIASVVVGCCLFLALSGMRGWYLWAILAVLVLYGFILWIVYYVHLSRSLGRLKRMQKPEALLKVTHERLCIESDLGTTAFVWSLVEKVWQFEEGWIIIFESNEIMTLPTGTIPVEMLNVMRLRFKESGVTVF